jgi:phage terminase small subunit
MTRHTLTGKQRAFVEAYLKNGRNGAAAYRAAYNTAAAPEHVARKAIRLLKHPMIAPIVAEAEAKAQKRVASVIDRYAVSKERILEELARMGFANMLDYVRIGDDGDAYVDLSALTRDQASAIAEVTVEDFKDSRGKESRDVRRVRFKLADKRAALMDLAKLAGLVIDKKEVTGKDGGPIKVEDARARALSLIDDVAGRTHGGAPEGTAQGDPR